MLWWLVSHLCHCILYNLSLSPRESQLEFSQGGIDTESELILVFIIILQVV